MARTYTVTINPKNQRKIITVHTTLHELPFNVFRDVGRLAGLSYDGNDDSLIFEFLVPENLAKAEKVLAGALFQRIE